MAIIKRQSPFQSIINLDGFDVRIFIKYKNGLANEIRVWKLPPNSNFLHMFNKKNLIWAIYNRDAKYLHGWFSKDGNFSETITRKVASCSNVKEIRKLLLDFEKIIQGEVPNNLGIQPDRDG